jgi:MYXO-CTERM domain-containing protein
MSPVRSPFRSPTRRVLASLSWLLPSPLLVFATVLVSFAWLAWPARPAFAGGGAFTIKTPSVDEKGGEWHIKVRIDLPRPPPMMHTPMRFTFSKDVVDERAIMAQGAEPVHHRMVVETPAKQIVSMDVDFADASGKVFKSTVFEFDLQRAKGYFEAGEYTVGLAGPDGDVGGAQKLVLHGDNPPVYRGSMDFTTTKEGKKGVKIQKVSSGLDGGSDDNADKAKDTPAAAAPMSTDVEAVGNAPGMVPDTAFHKTAEEEAVQDHPKGCGCITVGSERGSTAGVLAVLGIGAVVLRRRRNS